VVGWYEDADLMGEYVVRPAGFDPGGVEPSDDYFYSIRAPKAFLVPPEFRTDPFSHPSVRQGKYSFLAGPNVTINDNKRQVRAILKSRFAQLGSVAVQNPDVESAPDRDNDEIDPLSGFGTAEHRKAVEEAAVRSVKATLKKQGYECDSRERENVGYDLEATHENGSVLHVEVKGTNGKQPRFFMTVNEHNRLEDPDWRLAMVVDALTEPKVQTYNLRQFEREFDVTPMVWKGTKRIQD
jgi:hypothetical protein